MLPRRHRPVSRRAFQTVALLALALPFGATLAAAPHLPRVGAGTAFELPLRALSLALVALVFVVAWALALLPLRRRSRMPTLSEELARADAGSLSELYARARTELDAAARSPDPARRRRRHGQMAAGGVAVSLAAGGACALLWASSGTVLLEGAVVFVASVGLTLFHASRALRDRG